LKCGWASDVDEKLGILFTTAEAVAKLLNPIFKAKSRRRRLLCLESTSGREELQD
jgi:hypothetical protein